MMRSSIVCLVLAGGVAFADPRPDAKQLAADRIAAAHKTLELALAHYKSGLATAEDVYRWSLRVLDAELDGARGKAITAALQSHDDAMHDLDGQAKDRLAAGIASSFERAEAVYYAIEADLWLARGKR